MGAALHRTKESTHPPLLYGNFDFKDWVINPKGLSKSMRPFDNKSEHYKTWRSRVVDHLMSNNQGWGRVLELTEMQRSPLTKHRLAAMGGVDEAPLNLNQLSSHLWTFLGQHCLKDVV